MKVSADMDIFEVHFVPLPLIESISFSDSVHEGELIGSSPVGVVEFINSFRDIHSSYLVKGLTQHTPGCRDGC